VLWIALAIAASIATGVEAERRRGARAGVWARGILKFLLYAVMPLVAFFNIARLKIDADVGAGIPLGWAALLVTALVGWLVGRRVLRLEPPSAGVLAIVGLQANTGLLGIAVVAAVLGFDHVSQGVVYDALVQQPVFFVGSFAIAAATGTRAGETVPERVRAFFTRNPPLLAVALALVAPDALAPDVLVDASHVLVLCVPVLGFFAVGVTLAEEAEEGALKFPPPFTPQIGASILLRALVAPAILLALAAPLIHLPSAFLLAATMPAGLHIVVLAHIYGLDVPFAAGAIVWTTMVAVPILLVASVIV
jgi:predicted permease